jgi:hypothetical protein
VLDQDVDLVSANHGSMARDEPKRNPSQRQSAAYKAR